jgi:hypothetical protein
MHDSDRRRGRAACPGPPRAKVMNVVRVSSGNFLEMFDFMVFGYYASSIGRAFFPNENAFASLMLALMTFGAGFLMRPIGAVILGIRCFLQQQWNSGVGECLSGSDA